MQNRWLDALGAVGDRANPGFGHIGYAQDGATALEVCSFLTAADGEECHPSSSVGKCRGLLRGYSWLTIVAQELADRLGGFDALQATGAFAEVRQLAEGGVWLRATENFADYDMHAVEDVFRALRPIIRPGLPSPEGWFGDDGEPTLLVFADPAAS